MFASKNKLLFIRQHEKDSSFLCNIKQKQKRFINISQQDFETSPKLSTILIMKICRAANNETMLIMGIKKQKQELVRILLNNGADPNYIITDTGNTALHEALKLCKTKETKANREIVKLLI